MKYCSFFGNLNNKINFYIILACSKIPAFSNIFRNSIKNKNVYEKLKIFIL